jgi:hypothetical protein
LSLIFPLIVDFIDFVQITKYFKNHYYSLYLGLAKRYLMINGHWKDHNLYAITLEEWKGAINGIDFCIKRGITRNEQFLNESIQTVEKIERTLNTLLTIFYHLI